MPHQEAKLVYQRQEPAAGIDVLPDEALQHVLSFLPAREAVGTSVLARRWCHLWSSTPALRISSGVCNLLCLSEEGFNALNSFVNNLLLHRERCALLELCEFGVQQLEHKMDTSTEIDM